MYWRLFEGLHLYQGWWKGCGSVWLGRMLIAGLLMFGDGAHFPLPQRDYLLPLLTNIGRYFGCPMYE